MDFIPWLLLPVAAAAGWWSAQRTSKKNNSNATPELNDEYVRGLNYLLNEQPDKAIEALINVVDIDHETVNTHLVLGALFRRRGEVERAIRIHQNVIARPTLTTEQRETALLELGTDYLKAGVLDRAENIFRKLADKQSHNKRVYQRLQEIYEQEKDWQQAITATKKLTRLGDDTQTFRIAQYHCELADVLLASQKLAEAKAEIKLALKHDERCFRAHLLMGDVHTAQQAFSKAEHCYKKVFEINRGFAPIAYDRIFSMYATQNKLPQLLQDLESHDLESNAAARYTKLRAHTMLQDERAVREFLHAELAKKNASPILVKRYLELMRESTDGDVQQTFSTLHELLDVELANYRSFRCTSCGYDTNTLFWNCPTCRKWGTSKPNRFMSIEYGQDLD